MNILSAIKRAVIVLLIFLLAVPGEGSGQEKGAGPPFGKEELSRMLAPIALYPDALLADVLIAATFPLEVVSADRWVKQNKDLKGEQLDAALDKMKWDLSVKALVPFPEVLAMMSDKLDWTQALGAAFLERQKDVMDTVQKLRAMARAEGNLKSSREQKVMNQNNAITIEPANPTTIYVPSYNPEVVYGAWPYPAYPPYAYSPYAGAVAAGVLGFAAAVAVGAAWNGGWGNWNWGGGTVNVNVNRNFNINGNRVSHYQTGKWNQARRGGVSAQNSAARENFRGRSPNRSPSAGAGRPKTSQRPSGAKGAKRASQSSSRRRGQSVSGRSSASSARRGSPQGRAGGAFQGMGHGGYTRRSSQRGFSSRQASMGGRGFGGGRGGFSGGGRGGRGGRGGGRRR
jgi:hypothetical protein